MEWVTATLYGLGLVQAHIAVNATVSGKIDRSDIAWKLTSGLATIFWPIFMLYVTCMMIVAKVTHD